MKNTYKFFIFLYIIFSPSIYFAQIPGLINYNESNGLNCSYTYDLRQDYKGFIWVGSDNGIFRFDGKEFKQYGKKEGLKNIDVISGEPLPNGDFFLITFLNDFAYLKNGKVINSAINKYLKNQFSSTIPFVTHNGNKLYLYSQNNPENIFIYENEKLKKIPIYIDYKNYKTYKYRTAKFDFRSNLLYLFNSEKKELLIYNVISRKKIVLKISAVDTLFEKNNFIICRDRNEQITIYKITAPYTIKKLYSYNVNERVFRAIIDRNNKLWVQLVNGGVLYFNQSLTEEKETLLPPLKILKNYVINDVLVDKDDNVWFNSRNNGIFFITKAFFSNYINLPVRNNSQYIKAITKNDKDIIIGYNRSSGGIYRNGKIKDIVLDKEDQTENKFLYAQNDLVIFGFSDDIIMNHNSSNKSIHLPGILKNIIPYTNDSVILCTATGPVIFNTVNNQMNILFNERVYTALPYTKDDLFIGSFYDLYKFNIKTKKKTLFIEGQYFTDLKKLADHLYVGATNLNGIILFNEKGIIKKITTNDGLINDQIKKIEVENKNSFWASTNSGISRVEVKGKDISINNFTQTDGLPSNTVAGCVIKNDSLFVGTSKGLGIFSIKKLLTQEKTINKKVIINSVSIGNKEQYMPNGNLTGQSPDDVIFNLSFPDYASQGNISYKYKIEGLNDVWQISNSSKIILNSIPPGKYTFKVFGLGYNGKQSYNSTDVAFEIKPQFWQTWWFKLLVSVILLAVLLTSIISYLQKKRNKKLETLYYEKKIAELELQAIKAQINPHFIYNCLNSIQFLLYKKDYTETENYLDVFSQMIRKTLHYSEKTFMPVQEEIEYLTLYLSMEKLRLKDQFTYTIYVSERVNKNWIIPSLLVQPFVENAIKHGVSGLKDRKGQINITFDHADSSLCITIEDNGAGISGKSESVIKANSFGVKLSQKRIETFKQLFETNIILEINNLSEIEGKQGTQIKLYITPYEDQNTNLHH